MNFPIAAHLDLHARGGGDGGAKLFLRGGGAPEGGHPLLQVSQLQLPVVLKKNSKFCPPKPNTLTQYHSTYAVNQQIQYSYNTLHTSYSITGKSIKLFIKKFTPQRRCRLPRPQPVASCSGPRPPSSCSPAA